MKKWVLILLLILLAGTVLVGCSGQKEEPSPPPLDEQADDRLFELAKQLTMHLQAAENEEALSMMDEGMQKALAPQMDALWSGLTSKTGAFLEVGSHIGFTYDGYAIIEMTLVFEKGSLIQRTVFGETDLVSGLFFREGAVEVKETLSEKPDLPEGLLEEEVTVDAGTGYPLRGLLTRATEKESIAALVLIHGSGPSDRDETVGGNHVFLDLAHGLAQKGIAVLRYDKRTYQYAKELTLDPDWKRFGVDEEYKEDVQAAVRLLRELDATASLPVFLLGHSLSGALLSYFDGDEAGVSGYISMAGTPRKLPDLIAEQNEKVAAEFAGDGRPGEAEEIRRYVEGELLKAARVENLKDTEALEPNNRVFGMSAWYLRSFDRIDGPMLYLGDQKPLLILHGGQDRQVSEIDFLLWQERLSDHPHVEFHLFPALNHLMGQYAGDPVPFSKVVEIEYAARTPVDEEVIDVIGSFLLRQSAALREAA